MCQLYIIFDSMDLWTVTNIDVNFLATLLQMYQDTKPLKELYHSEPRFLDRFGKFKSRGNSLPIIPTTLHEILVFFLFSVTLF